MSKKDLDTSRRGSFAAALIYGVSAVAMGGATYAQEAGPAAGASQAGEPREDLTLGEVVVTARRRTERLIDVPVAATAISGQTLAATNVSDLQKLSQAVPLLNINKGTTGSGTSIYLRGIGSTSQNVAFDQAVSVNLDGIQISRGRTATQSYFDLERIEILKGPQALFFGKNSPAGIISIASADPTSVFEAGATVGYEFEARQTYGEAFVSGPLMDDLSMRLAVRASEMDGYFKNVAQPYSLGAFDAVIGQPQGALGRERGPAEEEFIGRLSVKYDRGPFDITAKFQSSTYDDNGPSSYSQLGSCTANGGQSEPLRGANGDPFDDCINNEYISAGTPSAITAANTDVSRGGLPYTEYSSVLASITANYEYDGVVLTSTSGYFDYDNQFYDTFDRSATSLVSGAETEEYRALSQEMRLSSEFNGPINYLIGVYYQDSDLAFIGRGRVAPHGPDATSAWSYVRDGGYQAKTYSAFGELRWSIAPEVELAGGARWTREEKDSQTQNVYLNAAVAPAFSTMLFTDEYTDENISPQVTLRWKPAPNLTVYGAYKTGYKSGGFDLGAILSAGFTTNDQLRFEAEEASGGELGLKGTVFDSQATFSAVIYDYTYDNLQVTAFDSATTSFFVKNAGAATTRGFEIDATVRPRAVSGLILNGSLAYNDAKFEDYQGQCYTGQSIDAGCNLTSVGGIFREQDYSGRTLARAPEWSGNLRADYERPLNEALNFGLGVTATYSDSYLLEDSLRSDITQDAFTKIDARVRLFPNSSGWELALIGRNLTNEFVASSGSDRPLSGSGTGTSAAIPADVIFYTQRPREVALQFKARF